MRLLKMDIYRMRKSRFSYVILTALILFLALECFVIIGSEQYTAAESAKEAAPAMFTNGMECAEYLIRGNVIALFVMFFAVTFVNTEFFSGFIKNTYSKEAQKGKMILSKTGVLALYIAMIFIAALMICLAGQFFSGHAPVFGDNWAAFTRFILVQYLLNVAFGTAVVCMATVLQNNAASLIVGFLYVFFGGLLYMLMNAKAAELLGIPDFQLSNYVAFGNLTVIGMDSSIRECVRASVVAVVVMAVAVLIGHLVLKKRDVR